MSCQFVKSKKRNYSGRLKGGKDGMTKQGSLQGGKQRHALLAQGGQVATNASKRLCASPSSEAARDLLLDFDHAQISFRLVVIKRDTQVFQKRQNGVLVFAQAIKQIACGALFDSSALARG